jgi:hypothetical protein
LRLNAGTSKLLSAERNRFILGVEHSQFEVVVRAEVFDAVFCLDFAGVDFGVFPDLRVALRNAIFNGLFEILVSVVPDFVEQLADLLVDFFLRCNYGRY